jgi:hypothetical protein
MRANLETGQLFISFLLGVGLWLFYNRMEGNLQQSIRVYM